MIKNYFKVAWRTITKNKVYSIINILGLTIGLSACMIVATVVIDDLSYDRQWSKGDDLYRIISVNKMGDGLYNKSQSSFAGLLPVLQKDFPEVEATAGISSYSHRWKLNEADPNGVEAMALRADTTFWKMLDISVLNGNPGKYIAGDNINMIITEGFRKKYFPNENPVGKIIRDVPTYSTKATPYIITGVIKDLPANTIMRTDVIIQVEPRNEELNKKQWGTFSQNYVLFKPGTDIKKFTSKLNQWYAGFVEDKNPYQFEFQSLKDCYLHSDFASYQDVKSDYKNILILSGIALLLLIIACVNFVNLGTARAIYRLKETGMRKILGAGRTQLIIQFLIESILFFLIGAVLATLLYSISLNPVENFMGHRFEKNFLSTPALFAVAFAGIILISLVTGLYPAWILSGFKPAATLKGKLFAGKYNTQHFVRKGLVVLQFAISIFVLIALIVVQNQVSYMKQKDLGFNKNNLLNISSVNWNGKAQTFKNELRKLPGVGSASISTWVPGQGAGYMSREIDNPARPNEKINVWYINGDADLPQTLGLQLKKGRLFDPQLKTDAVPPDSADKMEMRSALLTAYTAKLLHAQALNKYLSNVKIVPVGIIADFNNESLKKPMQPTIITAEDSLKYGSMMVRVQPGMERSVTEGINKMWRSFFSENLLEIKWVDDMVNQQYKAESRLQKIFTFFSTLTMLLAALGIFGLIMQATAQRIKEIGVRKVLGASVNSIVRLFSIDFLKLILIAIVIASPIAWWLMNKWLLDFAYRITINWWVFLVTGFVAIFIALLTISFQAIKAAIANPVKSLRTE